MSGVLAREWQVWAAENLLRGVARAEIEARLVKEGTPAALAAEALDALEGSPFVEASRGVVRDARRFAMIARTRELLERVASHPAEIPRIDAPSAAAFFDEWFVPARPVILRGLVSRWPAMERWQLAALAARLGDAQVTITVDRDADPLYGTPFERPTEALTLAALIARIEAHPEGTNAFYLVAQNKALEGPLAPMLDDIAMPEGWLDPASLAKGASLWLGPAGTRTRLHHDFMPVLACQVVGRKRWRLVPPTERKLLERIRRSHTTLDPDTDDLDGVLVKDVVLAPGEALFVPPGWWHHVVALDPALTVSITAWARPVDLRFLQLGA